MPGAAPRSLQRPHHSFAQLRADLPRISSRLKIERATGLHPALPPRLADLFVRPEYFTVLPNDLAAVEAQVRALALRNA